MHRKGTHVIYENVVRVILLGRHFRLLRRGALLRRHAHDLLLATDRALRLERAGANDELVRGGVPRSRVVSVDVLVHHHPVRPNVAQQVPCACSLEDWVRHASDVPWTA